MKSAHTLRKRALMAFLGAAALLATPAGAAEDPYKFMPKGGREMFVEALGRCANCDPAEIVASRRTAEDWLKYFAGRQTAKDKKAGVLAHLGDKQAKTLASYMAANLPLAKASVAKGSKIDWKAALPLDGRELTLEKCMGCHSLGATMLNDADLKGWDMILKKSDHRVLRMTDKEILTLQHYLTINAPVPEESVPKELRQSAGVY
jgi:hypothetical protein